MYNSNQLEIIDVYNVTLEHEFEAEVLEKSDKRIRVVIVQSEHTITLHRKDTRRPYVGFQFGYEFETFGVKEE